MSRHVFAHLVVRNEEHRYLQAALAALEPHVDGIHVHDDGSTDRTQDLAFDMGAAVTVRPPGLSSFLQSESACRRHAWEALHMACKPCPGDWVLAVDADEILVAPEGLWPAIDAASGFMSVVLPIPEVFGYHDGRPMVRTDGFWGGLRAPRLVRWRDGGVFRPQGFGCGAVPTYADHDRSDASLGVTLVHFGYAEEGDRVEKHHRYAGQPGHAAMHVASILRPPTLVPWDGPHVAVWRGAR